MKILQINSVCGIRSTGRICTDIADILHADGYESIIAYGREHVPEKYKHIAYRIGTDTGVRLHGVISRLLDRHGHGSKSATEKFIRWVKDYDPDVIHLHNIHGYYLNIRVLFDYLRTCGKKIVWTFHDCWPFTGHCSHFDLCGCDKWRTGCHNCPQIRQYPASFGFDRSEKNYREKELLFTGIPNMILATPSYWLADLVKQSFLKEYDVHVIPNGIDLDVFRPTSGTFREEYGLQDKKIVLGVSSVWPDSKGFSDFIKLSKMLPEDYRVVLVGVTPEQKASMPKNIIGITRTNNVTQLAQIYTAADVFVNPTYQDTYPTVNLEAQACGTPVITYRTGGSVESVPPEQVVEKGDVEALCRAVMNLEQCKIRPADYSAATGFQKYVKLYLSK